MLKAKEHCCEEASLSSTVIYVPCNKPATKLIEHSGEAVYRMCDMCADHNVRNRRAKMVGPYLPATSGQQGRSLVSNIDSIFEPTQPPLPANGGLPAASKKRGRKKRAAAPAATKPGKQARRARKVFDQAAQAAATPVKQVRRGRPRRVAGSSAVGGMKLDWTTAVGVLVGLKTTEAELVGKISTALQATNKKSRLRVLEAVGRIFA